jgi:hypothetical protein
MRKQNNLRKCVIQRTVLVVRPHNCYHFDAFIYKGNGVKFRARSDCSTARVIFQMALISLYLIYVSGLGVRCPQILLESVDRRSASLYILLWSVN